MSDLLSVVREDFEIVEDFANQSDDIGERGLALAALSRIKFQIEHGGKDKLLGGTIASSDLALSRATIDDMGVEIGRRDWGQPAVLCYQDRPGVWAVRMTAGVDAAKLFKVSSLMLSTAEAMPRAAENIAPHVVSGPETRFPAAETLFEAMSRREFEIRTERRWRVVEWFVAAAIGAALFSCGASLL